MIEHLAPRKILLVVAVILLVSSSRAYANIDLEWRPLYQEISNPGDTVEIGLYAVSDDETEQPISVIEAILVWNPERLELLGVNNDGPYEWAPWPAFPDDSAKDGLNVPYTGIPNNDGDAWYNARSAFLNPAMATPDGLLVTTFVFEARRVGAAKLFLIEQYGITFTRVISGPGYNVTGLLSGPATALIGGGAIPAVTEWGLIITSLLAFTLGTLVFGRKRILGHGLARRY